MIVRTHRLQSRMQDHTLPEPNTGCWLWNGAPTNSGYGSLWVDTMSGRRKVGAHRVAYELEYGPIPEQMTVDHRCCVKLCVNPKHLRLLTHRENLLVASTTIISTQMAKTTAPCGHPYDVKWGTSLRCRTCWYAYMRNWSKKRKASCT